MSSSLFPAHKVEFAPHVYNARYACPSESSGQDTFKYISGYEECDGQYRVSHMSYPYLILEMIVKGTGRLVLNKRRTTVQAGYCFCGGPGVDYELTSSKDDPVTKYFLAFGTSPSGNSVPKKYLYPGFTRSGTNPEDLVKWNELILREGSSQLRDSVENTSDLISILVRKIAPEAAGATGLPSTDALVIRALKEIERNFKTLRSLQELADVLAVSSEHLCRVFKANKKASPYRILTRRKMEHAYAQLKMTRAPIQEIAHSLGFTDGFHFSRAFKSRYGMPPSKLR